MQQEANVLAFWTFVLFGAPLMVLLGRVWRPFLYMIFGMLVISTLHAHWSITFISHPMYKSTTRGLEIHLADILAVVIAISMYFRPGEYPLRWRFPVVFPFVAYILCGLISWALVDDSITYASNPDDRFRPVLFHIYLSPFFELVKLIRGLFLFIVSANFLRNESNLRCLLVTLGILSVYIVVNALVNRYARGMFRVSIGQLHVNDFNVYCAMVGVFLFPFAFSTRNIARSITIWFFIMCILVAIILTVSRSSLVGYLGGLMLVAIVGMLRYPRPFNLMILVLGGLAGLVFLFKAYDQLAVRFASVVSDNVYRDALDRIAVQMGTDYLFGVGLGNYAAFTLAKYAGITGLHSLGDVYVIGHNIWYLNFAEGGTPGLLAFICLWIRYYYVMCIGLFRGWSADYPMAFPAILGSLCATLPLQMQNIYHFSLRQTSVFLLLMILMGAGVGMYCEMQSQIRSRRRAAARANRV